MAIEKLRELTLPYQVKDTEFATPVLLEQGGQALGVLISVEEFRHYQEFKNAQPFISAAQARRAANRAVFGDLVGCPISCGDPVWAPQPEPHWLIPYRLFDGALMRLVGVNAQTGVVAFTEQERNRLLEELKQQVSGNHVAATN